MHWPTSTLVSNLVPLKNTCSLEIRWQSLSRGMHLQLIALVTSRTPLNVLMVVTSDSEAMQRSLPGQTSWQKRIRDKVIGHLEFAGQKQLKAIERQIAIATVKSREGEQRGLPYKKMTGVFVGLKLMFSYHVRCLNLKLLLLEKFRCLFSVWILNV